MKNLLLVDDEKMPLVTHHDEDHQGDHHDDHDNYDILSTTVEEAIFTTPSFTYKQSTSTFTV